MAALLGGSSVIRTSVSDDLFDAKTNVAHHHEKASDNDGQNNGISAVTSTPPHAYRSKVAITTHKMIILFNQFLYIKVGYFGIF